MKYNKKTKRKEIHIGHALAYGSLAIGIAWFLLHTVDVSAEWRCSQLKDQAETFDGFHMSDSEKAMCDSVGVKIDVRYPEDMLKDMEQTAYLRRGESIPDPVFETPKWYLAQQLGNAKDRAYELLEPQLKKICACESTGDPDGIPQHYERDGVTVLTGRVTPADKGMCQISLDYHKKNAERMNLNVEDPFDNVAYANWLYEQEGTRPWNASRKCWQE
jgi:hypothetical protein